METIDASLDNVRSLSRYLVYSFFLLKEHARKIRQTYSFLEKINLNWLKFLLSGYGH